MSGPEIRTNRPIVLTNFKEEYYPYFFHNIGIEKGEVLYIVQKAKSVGQALAICATWKREKFNPTDETTEILYDVPYIKYLYNDNNDISKVEVNFDKREKRMERKEKSTHNRDLEILVYKRNDYINVVALLPFFDKLSAPGPTLRST